MNLTRYKVGGANGLGAKREVCECYVILLQRALLLDDIRGLYK